MTTTEEETALHETVGAAVVPRTVIKASGPDAEAFLQGQLSQDVVALQPGSSAWSLLLQPQGKVDAWLRVSRVDAETYILDLDHGHAEATLARLNKFKLRTKIEFEELDWQMVALRGPGVAELDAASLVPEGGLVANPEWPGIAGLDLLGPVGAEHTLPAGVAAVSPDAIEVLRISAGVPAMGSELTEATIPAEAGIVDRSANFTKGCYTGQELVARIDSRGGNVPRRLRGVRSAVPLSVGDEITVDGAAVGVVTSAAWSARDERGVGLAYIKRAVVPPAEAVAGGQEAQLVELPDT